MRIPSRAAAATAGAVFALLLGACGGDSEPAASPDPSPSQDATSSPATEEPEPDASSSATESDADPELSASSEAFLDRLREGVGEEGSVHVDLTVTGPVETTAEGDTNYGPAGSEMKLTMRLPDMPGELEMIVADSRAYLSLPGVTKPGKFFEVEEGNPLFEGLDAGLTPTDSFDAFEAGLQRVEELGDDEVAGEPVTRYRLHVDAEKALEATGQPAAPGMPETLTYDVWLDADDRMRRLVYELAGTELTMDMTDWGEPVSIQAPAKQDLVKAPPSM